MSDNAALIIMENDRIRTYPLCDRKQCTIGRCNDNANPDILISSPIAGRMHGQFIKLGSEWFYTDNGSINGTYYNGSKIKNGINGSITPMILSEGDVLRIDSGNFENPDPRGVLIIFTLHGMDGHWNEYNIGNRRRVTIGNDYEKCDIIIESDNFIQTYFMIKYVKNHFCISMCANNIEIFINNKPIGNMEKLKEKDVIRINNKYWIYAQNSIIYNTNCKLCL